MKFSGFFRAFALAGAFAGSLTVGVAVSQSTPSIPSQGIDVSEPAYGRPGSQDFTSGLPTRFSGSSSVSADFNDISSNETPYVGDAPLDENAYKVGPGDLFQIVIEGSSFERQVNPEGNLILNRIGVVRLGGLTLKEAKAQILNNLQTSYKRSNCFVNLSRPKLMRVFVTGGVNYPGIYEIYGNFRVSDAIRKAGGFSLQAQKGTVEIRGKDADARTINTRNFMINGDLSANPYVEQGSMLFVPFLDYAKPWVTVRTDSASFTVQMDSGETVADLVLKSYSFRNPPAYAAVLVTEKNGKDSLLSPAEAIQYRPNREANIEVVSSRQEIFVGGAVLTPGRQVYRSDQKVVEYISRAGVLTSSRIPRKVTVIRKNGTRESIALQDSGLRPGDVVFVGQNTEQKFLIYTPILLSMVSLALVYIQITSL